MFDTKKVADTYDQIGLNFSATRGKLSPEVISLLPRLPKDAKVLDLGCGNGVLLASLPDKVDYTGIDFSGTLINEAKRLHPEQKFILADIADPQLWNGLGPLPAGPEGTRGLFRSRQEFDFIAALAVLHHLPESKNHEFVLSQIKNHLKSGGTILLSNWRLREPKFDRFRTDPRHLSIPFHHGPNRDFYAFTDEELAKIVKNLGFSQTKLTISKDNLYLTAKLGLDNK